MKLTSKYADEIAGFSVRNAAEITDGIVFERSVQDKGCFILFILVLIGLIATFVIVFKMVKSYEDVWELFLDYAPETVQSDAHILLGQIVGSSLIISLPFLLLIIFSPGAAIYSILALLNIISVSILGQLAGFSIIAISASDTASTEEEPPYYFLTVLTLIGLLVFDWYLVKNAWKLKQGFGIAEVVSGCLRDTKKIVVGRIVIMLAILELFNYSSLALTFINELMELSDNVILVYLRVLIITASIWVMLFLKDLSTY